jgi:pimeloyl-ACP methyl ester carboxylesterase
MATVAGFPYFPLQFDKHGAQAAGAAAVLAALEQHLATTATTDLLVLSHGWNNNMPEAEALYAELLGNMRTLIDTGAVPGVSGRSFAVLAVLWPSKKFDDAALIPSGAAGVGSVVRSDELRAQIEALKGAFDAADGDTRLDAMAALLPRLEDSDSACREFVELARGLVRDDSADEEDAADRFFSAPPKALFDAMALPVSFVAGSQPGDAGTTGGAAGLGSEDETGSAAGLGSFFSGALSGARNILNYTTYYQMKDRAGHVGASGVNPLLRSLTSRHPQLRLHLIGHSFGGRLVAAAAAGADQTSVLAKVGSMALLQAAFSHYGFSGDWDGSGARGFFRRVIDTKAVAGPVIITCTERDKAVGTAYPIASLLANQVASGLGDKHSKYGGIGRNGAQKSDAIDAALLEVGAPYAFTAGRLHNLEAGALIKDHGDVANPRVAYAVLTAVASA